MGQQTEGVRPTRAPVQSHLFLGRLMQLLTTTVLPALISTSQKGYSHIHTYTVPPPGVVCPVVTLAIWDGRRKNWNHEKYKNPGFGMTPAPCTPKSPFHLTTVFL